MNIAKLSQPDFDFQIENPDWVALRILLARIEEDIASRRKHLLRRISDWLLALEMFAEFEDGHMVLGDPTVRDHEYYRAFLAQLMAHGEKLNLDLEKASEVDPAAIGLKGEDLRANLTYLRDKYARSFFSVAASRSNAILESLREPMPRA